MGEWLLELFIRGSHRSAMVDPHLFLEVLLLISKASPPCPVQGLRQGRAVCAISYTVCSYCFLEMFWGVDPSPLARFQPRALGDSGWRGPACFRCDLQLMRVRQGSPCNVPVAAPRAILPLQNQGKYQSVALLESPESLGSTGLLLLGFANRWEFASPWQWPSSSQGCGAAREVCPGLYICTSLQGTPAVIILTSHWMSVLIDTDEVEGLFYTAAEKTSPS